MPANGNPFSTHPAHGLDDEEKAERLLRLLVMHLVLDRTVTARVALNLSKSSSSFSTIEAAVARVPMEKRIDLARAIGAISDSCADDMKAVNQVRNKCAHYNPHIGKLTRVPEVSSEAVFEICATRAMRSIRSLTGGKKDAPKRRKTFGFGQ